LRIIAERRADPRERIVLDRLDLHGRLHLPMLLLLVRLALRVLRAIALALIAIRVVLIALPVGPLVLVLALALARALIAAIVALPIAVVAAVLFAIAAILPLRLALGAGVDLRHHRPILVGGLRVAILAVRLRRLREVIAVHRLELLLLGRELGKILFVDRRRRGRFDRRLRDDLGVLDVVGVVGVIVQIRRCVDGLDRRLDHLGRLDDVDDLDLLRLGLLRARFLGRGFLGRRLLGRLALRGGFLGRGLLLLRLASRAVVGIRHRRRSYQKLAHPSRRP
jgi:hypothetical protein